MPTPLADMIARIRNDLHDNDNTAYRWTDAVLQRHIERAMDLYSLAAPIETKSTLTTTAGSRDVSISSLTPRIHIAKVEYPVGYYPAVYPRFTVWGDTLALVVDDEPSATNNLYVFWGKAHSIGASATTIPSQHYGIVETGAAAMAAIEWANYAVNRVNVGDNADRDYLKWGLDAMVRFRELLAQIDYRRKLRSQQLTRG